MFQFRSWFQRHLLTATPFSSPLLRQQRAISSIFLSPKRFAKKISLYNPRERIVKSNSKEVDGALASFHSALYSACILQSHKSKKCEIYLWKTSSHLNSCSMLLHKLVNQEIITVFIKLNGIQSLIESIFPTVFTSILRHFSGHSGHYLAIFYINFHMSSGECGHRLSG